MSLKDLFSKNSASPIQASSIKELGDEIESSNHAAALLNDKNRFVPAVDFSDPSKFAKFGSAEKYYVDTINNILKTYPYDGSQYEKINWHNSSSNLQNYIFENEYPRTNGYINIGYSYGTYSSSVGDYSAYEPTEYIFVKGGPNNFNAPTLKEQFSLSNKIEINKNRNYNLYINGNTGATVEFWLKKNDSYGDGKQVIFDLWNNISFGDNSYGRFRAEIHPGYLAEDNKIFIEILSGSFGAYEIALGSDLSFSGSDWNHYAISFINTGSNLKIELLKNGILNDSFVGASSISEVTGAYTMTIGSLITQVSGVHGGLGYGKLSGSIDEFRYWKNKRTDKNISDYWKEQVGGGTNTDDSNTSLGLYFKFNEGIFDNLNLNSYDTKVLDYSGRISNGTWYGYSIGSRNTGSAIVESKANNIEFKDPIIYKNHPEILSLIESKIETAKEYDMNNNSSIINTFPQWMIEQDMEGLGNLTQVISEYFDDLYLKIENLPRIKDMSFREGKPIPFTGKLLESFGFVTTEMFSDASIIETFLSKNKNLNFEEKLHDIKNTIYQNIYNNLIYIYRSKGTEKSIRNIVRCFGVDDSLIKINAYADGVEYKLDDRYTYSSVKKNYIDFNNVDRFNSTVYQYSDGTDPLNLSYIIGNKNLAYLGSTLEFETIFPKKYEPGSQFYIRTDFLTSSLAGMHEANSSSQLDLTWPTLDRAHISIYAIRPYEDSKDAYFKISSSYFNIELNSKVFKNVYENNKWNFAVKIYHEKYPLSNILLGTEQGDYIIELHGINTESDIVLNEFKITGSISQSLALEHFGAAKRIYIGSHHYNFTGSVVISGLNNAEEYCDAKISSVRYWTHKLSDETLYSHALDAENIGTENPYENVDSYILMHTLGSIPFNGIDLRMPKMNSLILNWDFSDVTGSDNGSGFGPPNTSDGKFNVIDLTNGTFNHTLPENQLLLTDDITTVSKIRYNGRGDLFLRNDISVVDRENIQVCRKNIPESIIDADMINILTDDDNTFKRDSQPINHYFIVEKSMYQIISQEILKIFGTIKAFNNIIGEPSNRYKQKYDNLERLRELYFANVNNQIDFEKFVDLYKWLDDSIGIMIKQLIPASANCPPELKTIIESHILERNKYWNKFPTLETKKNLEPVIIKGINELKYNWKTGHAPLDMLESSNCLWWKKPEDDVNILQQERGKIYNSIAETLNRKFKSIYDFSINQITIIDKKPTRYDYVNNIVKFNSNEYLQIDAAELPEDKDCKD